MAQITQTIQYKVGGQVEHPDGVSVRIPARAFTKNSVVKVNCVAPERLDEPGIGLTPLGNTFQISCSNPLGKEVAVAFVVRADVVRRLEAEKGHAVVEMNHGCESTLVSAPLKKQTGQATTDYVIEMKLELPRLADAVLTPGYVVQPAVSSYITMPHQFKISPLDVDEEGHCRRAGSGDCDDPKSQSIYPACYPAAWAKLYSTYRLVLPPVKRRLEIGTTYAPDPSPDEDGDYFSTWAMGTNPIGATPQAFRVEDWNTGGPVEICELRFPLEPGVPLEDAVRDRAELIKRSLLSVVGRFHLPVFIAHSGHAWNVFGADSNGYWSHSQNPDANCLSDWCEWGHAEWLEGELALVANPDKEPHASYVIKYPVNCQVKPRNKRLGSMSFSGHYARFIELIDRDNLMWTPFISPERPDISYLWIESSAALDRDGRPSTRRVDLWDDALGHMVPVPEKERRACTCRKADGCPHCRTRLLLAFWVNNLTKDELHHYRVDIYFWTATNRWISMDAIAVKPTDGHAGTQRLPVFKEWYPDVYTFPSPGPWDEFALEATPDTSPVPFGDRHPLNWQPMLWYVDLGSNHLKHFTVHGIKLVLTCTDPEDDAHCVVQDVKQLWFKTLPPSVY